MRRCTGPSLSGCAPTGVAGVACSSPSRSWPASWARSSSRRSREPAVRPPASNGSLTSRARPRWWRTWVLSTLRSSTRSRACRWLTSRPPSRSCSRWSRASRPTSASGSLVTIGWGWRSSASGSSAGGLPDPDRADEVVVNEAAAALVGVDVGDEVDVATLTPEQVLEEEYFPPRGPMLPFHVVGVVRGTDDVVEDADGGFYASPALYDVVHGQVDEFTTYLGVTLVDDASVEDFDAALAELIPPEQEYQTLSLDERSNAARGTISAVASGLAVFALVAAVAAIVAVGQAVGRHVAGAQADADDPAGARHHQLRSIGRARADGGPGRGRRSGGGRRRSLAGVADHADGIGAAGGARSWAGRGLARAGRRRPGDRRRGLARGGAGGRVAGASADGDADATAAVRAGRGDLSRRRVARSRRTACAWRSTGALRRCRSGPPSAGSRWRSSVPSRWSPSRPASIGCWRRRTAGGSDGTSC